MFTIIFSLLLFLIVAGVFHGSEVSVGCDVGRIYLVVSCQKKVRSHTGQSGRSGGNKRQASQFNPLVRIFDRLCDLVPIFEVIILSVSPVDCYC